jgi:hypothetical protein
MSRAPATRRRVAASIVALVSLVVAFAGLSGPAAAANERHAAVIVETGEEVHQVVIRFSEDSISGIEALQRAGADPSVAGFAGLGGGVCALYGVGHPATVSECLGVPSDPRYWAYWHVPAGRSGFDDSTYSRAGAGTVRVRDGDTEGWRFGTGDPPTFVTLALPEPDPPSATAPPVPAPAASTGAPAGPAPGGGSAPDPAAPGASAAATSTTLPAPGGSAAAGTAGRASTTSTTRSRAEVAAQQASATGEPGGGGSGGGTALSLVGFAAVLVALAAGIYFARRARVGSRPSGP